MEEPRFKVMDKIRVVDGHFKGLTGTVVRIGYAAGYLTAKVEAPGAPRPATVEFRDTEVELDDAPRPPE
jgi:transcription antitermination factor NusG